MNWKIAANGYIRFSTKVIIQWIHSHSSSTQDWVTVTLPGSFTSTNYSAIINFADTESSESSTRRCNSTQITAVNKVKYYSIKIPTRIIAIGY